MVLSATTKDSKYEILGTNLDMYQPDSMGTLKQYRVPKLPANDKHPSQKLWGLDLFSLEFSESQKIHGRSLVNMDCNSKATTKETTVKTESDKLMRSKSIPEFAI